MPYIERYYTDRWSEARKPGDNEELQASSATSLSSTCGAYTQNGRWVCTRPPHSDGDHIACGSNVVLARWRVIP